MFGHWSVNYNLFPGEKNAIDNGVESHEEPDLARGLRLETRARHCVAFGQEDQ